MRKRKATLTPLVIVDGMSVQAVMAAAITEEETADMVATDFRVQTIPLPASQNR
jgi:hypothetical protein